MGFLKELGEFLIKISEGKLQFKADVHFLENVKDIKVGESNTTYVDNRTLIIGDDALSNPEAVKKLTQIFQSAIDPKNKQAYFSVNNGQERLLEVREADICSSNIDFFRGKISDTDFIILQTASVVKNMYIKGNQPEANRIKHETVERYGKRANNIINLYAESYFDTTLKPLYEILYETGDADSVDIFDKMYRIIVSEEVFTLFVSTTQTEEQVYDKLKEKIEVNRSYGAYKINIHGINKSNVDKINNVVVKLIEEKVVDGMPNIIQKGHAIMAQIKLSKREGDVDPSDDVVSII